MFLIPSKIIISGFQMSQQLNKYWNHKPHDELMLAHSHKNLQFYSNFYLIYLRYKVRLPTKNNCYCCYCKLHMDINFISCKTSFLLLLLPLVLAARTFVLWVRRYVIVCCNICSVISFSGFSLWLFIFWFSSFLINFKTSYYVYECVVCLFSSIQWADITLFI